MKHFISKGLQLSYGWVLVYTSYHIDRTKRSSVPFFLASASLSTSSVTVKNEIVLLINEINILQLFPG